ncbi:dihydrofolate reductase [Anaeromicropila populeti]|uniref:dihydrofolate reductase n=1 Tax=Anaeromicropila populeti TaxID=37658 RepID=A0A1I6KR81_9FIRM|nr:dihydrofolate reductase [Anaeromicropila populeti]SFR93765.1 dihydrofolate reductase [Anaeromicropila populeti]
MNLIVAVDNKWAIGNKNQLLVSIPSDKRNFRLLTENQVVIMGRKTLESLPNGMPLENRVNIVLTKNLDYTKKGIIPAHSLEDVFTILQKYNDRQCYVIGGASIYQQFLPFCDTAYVTKIEYSYVADRFAPNLDKEKNWILEGSSEEETYYDLEYYFLKYRNTSVLEY